MDDHMHELPGHGRKAIGAAAGVALFDQSHANAMDALQRQAPGFPFVMVLSTRNGTRIVGAFVDTIAVPAGALPTEDDANRAAATFLRFAAEALIESAEHYEEKINSRG